MKNRVSTLTEKSVNIITGAPYSNGKVGEITALLGFYEKNKFPMVIFQPYKNGNKFFNSAEFSAARERHLAALQLMRGEYILVRDRWARYGVPCLLIKSGGSFLPFPYTSDNLDILVHQEHEAAARAVLLQLGYVELKNLEEPQKFLFRKFRGGVLASDIHLHTRVGWGVGFMDDKSLWENARISQDDKSATIPSPEDTILITIAHSFYENKTFRLADLVKIQECWQNKIDWDYVKDIAEHAGWLDGLYFCIGINAHLEKAIFGKISVPRPVIMECRAEMKKSPFIYRYYMKLRRRSPVSVPFSVSFLFSKYLFFKKILQDRRDNLRERLYQVFRTFIRGVRLKLKLRPQAPFLVSFSGIDGSGKTQHAHVLEECLNHYGLRTSYHWSRCATSGIIRLVSALSQTLFWRKVNNQKGENTSSVQRRQRLDNPVLRFFWTYLTAIDMIVLNFFKVKIPLLKGNIVICDRYIFDAAAEMESSLPSIDRFNRLAIKLMMNLAPTPDMGYFLDVPQDVSTQRRDTNTDTDYLQKQRNVYVELINRYRLRIKRTDRDFADNTDEILREVAKRYFKSYPTLLNGLFLSNPAQINRRAQKGQA